ncbi:MAG: lysylphosphatidylglycerol synthase transmembrane domain-containing protein [Candidatus Hodarchaeota archaeon]
MVAKTFRFVIGISLALGLIYITLESTGGNIWTEILQAQKHVLLPALLFHGFTISIVSFRWNLLLKVQQINLGVWDLIRLTTTGLFFNLAIPGAVGGDIIKFALLCRQTGDKKAESFLTVALDRAIGLLGLFIVATIAILLSLPFLLALDQKYRPLQIAAFIVGSGSIAGIFAIALMEFRQALMGFSPIAKIVMYGERKLPGLVVTTIKRLVEALKLYRHNRSLILLAIALSVLIHSCLALNLFLIGKSLGENALRLHDYFLVVPIANAFAAIPVTPAGIGTRDAIVAMFLSAMKVPIEKAGIIPVVATLIILFWGLIGGIIFAFSKVPRTNDKVQRLLNRKDLVVTGLEVK